MFWLLTSLLVLLALCVAAVPGEVFGYARANTKTPAGQTERVRQRKELVELGGFLAGAVILPAMALVGFATATVLVHRFVVPIPFVADVFAGFDASADVWEQNIETGEQGDLGARESRPGGGHNRWPPVRLFSITPPH